MHRENILGTEAQRTINQINQTAQQRAQESVRQEAHQYRATLVNFAENEYQSKIGAAKAQAKKEAAAAKEQAEKDIKAAAAQAKKEAAAEVAKAKKEAKEAKEQAKKAAQSEHNTEFRADPTTTDKTARAKAKTGPPPKTTGERASGSQDNPEYTHEPKGKAGRPKNTQANAKDKTKAKSKGPDIKVDTKTKPEQPPPKNNKPNHDTDRDVNIKPSYWRSKGIGYMRDQLTKRGFRETRKPDGNKILRADYLREILRRIDAGIWA
jgi:colicin import membrane protein